MSNQDRPIVGVGIIVFRDIDGKPHIMLHQRKSPMARATGEVAAGS